MRRSRYLALTATAAVALVAVGYGATTSLASPAPRAKGARSMPALKLAKLSVKQGSGSVKASALVNAKGRAVFRQARRRRPRRRPADRLRSKTGHR
jgi:hypothetical protein